MILGIFSQPLDKHTTTHYITCMINYDDLDEMYGNLPTRQPSRGNTNPVGSLTDNRRKVEPNRNGAKARYRSLRKLKWDTNEVHMSFKHR